MSWLDRVQAKVMSLAKTVSSIWLSKLSLVVVVVLVGCANEPPPVPPAELTSTSGSIRPLKIWSANVGEAGRGRFEPQVIEQQLVSASRSGKVISYSRDNGIRQWSNDLKVRLTSGVSGDDNQVYVGDIDGVLHALDRNSGESKWTARGSSEILVPASANYGALIVRSTDGRVVSLDPDSGEEIWTVSHAPPALSLNGYSRPLLLDGGVLIGLDDGRLLALNTSTGKLILKWNDWSISMPILLLMTMASIWPTIRAKPRV